MSDAVREELRKTAIKMINKGVKKGKVAEMLGCHPGSITNWWKVYKGAMNMELFIRFLHRLNEQLRRK
jgi:uncharacterized protein YjcR